MKIQIFLLFLCLSFLGCVNFTNYDPYNRYYPKSPDWTLKNVDHDPEMKICHDCVYLFKILPGHSNYGTYLGFRFFNTGQLIGGRTKDPEDISFANYFNQTSIGYYHVRGNRITLEYFSSFLGGIYAYYHGYFNENGDIVIDSYNNRGRSIAEFEDKEIYKKISVKDLKPLVPDW